MRTYLFIIALAWLVQPLHAQVQFQYGKFVRYDGNFIEVNSGNSGPNHVTYDDYGYRENWDVYNQSFPTIRLFIKYGKCHNKLTKPFVFVEGISFEKKLLNNSYSLTQYFYLNDEQGQLSNDPILVSARNQMSVADIAEDPSVGFSTFNWATLVTGIDAEGVVAGSPLHVEKLPALLQQLYDNSYDIVFVDFESGQEYIENNGYALAKGLKLLKDSLDNNNSNEKLTVCGASMGGLVSRFAIRELEQNGGPTYDHCVGKFISFDSPQLGANINLGLQYTLQNLKGLGDINELKTKYTKLTCPSASQLVLYSCLENPISTLLTTKYTTAKPSKERDDLLNHANITTWPQHCGLYSIINGSRLGDKQNNGTVNDCDLIFDGDGLLDLNIKTLPKNNDGYCRVFDMQVGTSTCNIPTSLLSPMISRTMFVKNSLAIDHVSGSYRKDLQELTSLNHPVNTYLGILTSNPCSSYNILTGSTSTAPSFCFIPSMSAAGIIDFNNKVENSDTELPNLFNGSYKLKDPSHTNTYFDVVYAPEHNQSHVEITDENIAWLMEILDDCDGHAMLFQNENINNGTHTSCDYIKAGADVGKGNGVGNATVLSNSSVAFKAYDFISLEPGFVVEPGATFEASIFEVTNCSGNRFAATSSTGTNKGKSNSNYVTNASVTLQDATAQVTRSGLKMLLQPNPAQESTSIYYTVTKASEVSISIRNMYGSESLYPSSTQYKQTGEYVEEIPTSHLPKGVYIVTLHTTEGSMSKRLIIQ